MTEICSSAIVGKRTFSEISEHLCVCTAKNYAFRPCGRRLNTLGRCLKPYELGLVVDKGVLRIRLPMHHVMVVDEYLRCTDEVFFCFL